MEMDSQTIDVVCFQDLSTFQFIQLFFLFVYRLTRVVLPAKVDDKPAFSQCYLLFCKPFAVSAWSGSYWERVQVITQTLMTNLILLHSAVFVGWGHL